MDESELDSSEDLKEKKRKILSSIKKSSSEIYYAILAAIILIGVNIRLIPMKINPATGKPWLWDVAKDSWTLGLDLDPFLFLRYAKDIVKHGSLMAHDAMRYVPLGHNTANEAVMVPYLIAYLHKFLNFFGDFSVEYAAVILPVISSFFMIIFFFLFVRKVFEAKGRNISAIIALIATAFLAVFPIALGRTMAGIPEKESVGFCLIFASFYFFLKAWKAKKIRNSLIFGIVSGLVTAFLGLSWGGIAFVFATIAIATFAAFILEKIDIRKFVAYSGWLFAGMLFYIPFTLRTSLKEHILSPGSGTTVFVWLLIVAYFILYKTKLKDTILLQKQVVRKIPKTIFVAVVLTIILLIGGSIIFGSSFVPDMGKAMLGQISPAQDRITSTIAENQRIDFLGLKELLGPVVQGIPIFFWLFFLGCILLFYEAVSELKLKERLLMTLCYLWFMASLIFSKYSSSGILDGESAASIVMELSGYLILLSALAWLFYKRVQKNELGYLKIINFDYIFILSLILVAIISTKSGLRFIIFLACVSTITAAYLIVEIARKGFESRDSASKTILWSIILIVLFASIFTFGSYYAVGKSIVRENTPSSYTQQWQYAMKWVSESTPKDAVFGHWWDYGYWVQSMGERATMLDGGNVYGYWNYLMGRHVLTGETEEEALEVLYNHNVTYFLIDSTDIGKYPAYSLIGSDEKNDRHSEIGIFKENKQGMAETDSEVAYIYNGNVALDEDIILQKDGKKILIPAEKASVGGITTRLNKNSSNYSGANVLLTYNSRVYEFPVRYIFQENRLIDFGSEKEDTLDACIYIFPELTGTELDKNAMALYISPRGMKALFVQMYLFNKGRHFKIVHSEPSYETSFLADNGLDDYDIIYHQELRGPIKIWKIEYTGDEKTNPEYMQTDFPEKIANRAIG